MKRAVLMIVDGLRADMMSSALTPNLWSLAQQSRLFRAHRAVFPSATRVSSASIATGCYPAAHGLAGNAIALDEGNGLVPVSVGPPEFLERWRRATGRTLLKPTLAERTARRGGTIIYSNSSPGSAHMQDPDAHGWLFHRSGSRRPGGNPIVGAEHLEVSHDARGDAATTERFCASVLSEPDTLLHVLWICEPDHSQHVLELGSQDHRDVLHAADGCVTPVREAVEAVRARGHDVLLVLGSDHGHETVQSIIPVNDLLVEAGFKASTGSDDVVLASSGMGALLYIAPGARDRTPAIASWLAAQPWCGEVRAGHRLAELGQSTANHLGIGFSMAKTETLNRFGVPGYGCVAADPFMHTDTPGCGQHGGLGRYETRPLLMINGSDFAPGSTDTPSSLVDIAPTIADHLGVSVAGMDGGVLGRC